LDLNGGDPNQTPRGRLSIARKFLSLSIEDFAKKIGKSRPALSQIESGKSELSMETAMALQVAWEVSWRWIMYGEGSMWVPRSLSVAIEEETEFIDRPLIAGAASYAPNGEIEDSAPTSTRYVLRRSFAENVLKRSGGGKLRELYFLRCEGESMSPTIRNSEIALVNTAIQTRIQPKNNAIYLVRKNTESQEGRLKRVSLDEESRRLHLGSDNPAYASLSLVLDDVSIHQLILGRVCWVGRNLLEIDPLETDW
jgi:transcriptional regulator with XRE-family HTH domain